MREADRFYMRALELLDEDAQPALELHLRRGTTLYHLGKVREAQELLVPLADHARIAGRLDLRCAALGHLAQIDHRQGRVEVALERLDEALRLAVQAGDRQLQVRVAFSLASVKGDTGAIARALEELGHAISIAEEIDDRALRVDGHLRAGMMLYNQGALADAEGQFERCLALAAELGSSRDEARATYALAVIKYLRGEAEEAERLGEQARTWLQRTGETFFQIQNHIALAQYALGRDDLALAEERLREALPTALEEGALEAMDIYRLLTETLVRQGRLSDAIELAEFAGRDVVEENVYALATLRIAEAAVATAQRHASAAVEGYTEAISLLEQLDLKIEVLQSRLAFGRALRELGEAERARQELERVREAWLVMGATGLVAEVDRELALVGSRAGISDPASK